MAGVPAGYVILDAANDAGSSTINPAEDGSATGPDGIGLVDNGQDQGPTTGADAGIASPAGADASAASSFDFTSLEAPARGSDLTELSRLLGDTGALLANGAPVKAPRLDFAPPLVNPLRAALLLWVESTNADVPADELARALDDADRLPASVQRDLSILVAAAAQASTLQREALSALTPDEIAWLESHPEAARALAKSAETGVATPEAEKAAALAARVDPVKSVQAALLMTNALEQTRESLKAAVDAGALDPEALRGAPLASAAPDNALAVLDLLTAADGGTLTREAKLGLAGDLIVAASGLSKDQDPRPFTPDLPAKDPLPAAMLALAAAADPVRHKEYEALMEPGLARARALPQDLQGALAVVVLARAETLDATRTAFLESGGDADAVGRADAIGALRTLSAMERALPVLQKYAIVYGDAGAPGVAHVTEPAVGYVETYRKASAIAQASTRLEHAVRAAGLAAGVRAEAVPYDGTDLTGGVERLYAAAGLSATREEVTQMKRAALSLPTPVQNAAAIMVVAAADATVLRNEAFANLSDAEYARLFTDAEDVMALVNDESSWVTREDVDRIAEYAELAGRVDEAKLLASALTLAAGADAAKRILEDAGYGDKAYEVQALDWTEVSSGFRGLVDRATSWLKHLVPFGTARAQGPPNCPQDELGGNDIIFCDALGLVWITGEGESTWMPALSGGRPVRIPILLDLGGRDFYGSAVGAYGETWAVYGCGDGATDNWNALPVGLLLEMGGNDVYDTPDGHPLCATAEVGETPRPWRGAQAAGMGGVGFIVDATGNDYFNSYSHTQGYGWFGVGGLFDPVGDDTREARELAHGASFSGFGLHLGVLVDRDGTDTYAGVDSQGYGMGGVFVDLLADDDYRAPEDAHGLDTTAYLHLDQDPARLHSERGNLKVWRDGPSNIHLGYGVDTHVEGRDSDGDQFPDFLEGLLGSDPERFADTPESRAAGLTQEGILKDSDRDGFADVIENAMGTDPRSAKSAPVGAPGLPRVAGSEDGGTLAPLFNAYADLVSNDTTGTNGPYASDKILDVRVPFPGNGVTIESLCSDWHTWAFPRSFAGQALYENIVSPSESMQSDEPERDERTSAFHEPPCSGAIAPPSPAVAGESPAVNVTIPPHFRGGGNTTLSDDGNVTQSGADSEGQTKEITVRVPPGLFALGNVGHTLYDVEYLLQVDLGGGDEYHAATGGGTFLRAALDNLNPPPSGMEGAASLLLPVGLVSFDLDVPRPASAAEDGEPWGNDAYVARARDTNSLLPFAHGAGGGILVDTEGNDHYEAGAFSQGALAGLLLDLAGADTYRAGDHSQGANVAFPFELHEGLSRVQNVPADGETTNPAETRSYTMTRHAYTLRPALLVDAGAAALGDADTFVAGNRSQGYGYGLLRNVNVGSDGFGGGANTRGMGVVVGDLGALVDLDGASVYVAKRYAQGVARGGGVGLLVDAHVNADASESYTTNDQYYAEGPSTMGAIEPAHVNRLDGGDRTQAASGTTVVAQDIGGVGALVDMSGWDHYRQLGALTFDRTEERQGTTTLRTATGSVEPEPVMGKRYAVGIGVHADYEASGANRDGDANPDFLESLAGTSTRGATADEDTMTDADVTKWLVHLPAARFAIGGTGAQNYTRDYAFVVDFGGENVHTGSAGGPITDLVLAEGGEDHVNFLLTAFPVTFVYEAANANTTYVSGRDLTQGVGYFTVGMLVDEGGEDTYRVIPDERPSFPSGWTELPPVINGDIRPGASEWATSANTLHMDLLFEEMRTPGLAKDVDLYVANDDENLYVGVQYAPIRSPDGKERHILNENELWMYFDSNDDGVDWDTEDKRFDGKCHVSSPNSPRSWSAGGWSSEQRSGYPGTDGVRVWKRADTTDHFDDVTFAVNRSRPTWDMDCDELRVTHQDVTGIRRYRDGVITVEFKKPLNSMDPQDIAVIPDGQGAWLNPEIGFRIALKNVVTGEEYAWPPKTAAASGQIGSDARWSSNWRLNDELEDWALLTVSGTPSRTPQGLHPDQLNFTGTRGVAFDIPEVDRVFSQGAGVGGVGVLAALGNVRSSSVYDAGAFALGFGGWQGTGVLLDGGGSDRYSAKRYALGAALAEGALTSTAARDEAPTSGAFPSYSSTGLVMELEGNDVYSVEDAGFGHATTPSTGGAAVSLFVDAGGSDSYAHPASKLTFGDAETPPMDNLAWQGDGNAFGVDGAFAEEYVYKFTTIGAAPTYAPELVPLVHSISSEDGSCAVDDEASLVRGSRLGAYITEPVCLSLHAHVNPTAQPELDLERVDVLVGGALFDSITKREVVKLENNESWWRVVVPEFDPEVAGDGPRSVQFLAYFAPQSSGEDLERQRVLLVEDAALQLLVDTAPRLLQTAHAPSLDASNAVGFSPTGVGRVNELRVDWEVSRDLGEDIYRFYSYRPTHSNMECGSPASCDVIPFYMNRDYEFQLTPPTATEPTIRPDDNTPEGPFQLTLSGLEKDLTLAEGHGLGFWVYRDFLAPGTNFEVTTRVNITEVTATTPVPILDQAHTTSGMSGPTATNALRPVTNQIRSATGVDVDGSAPVAARQSASADAMAVCHVSGDVRACGPGAGSLGVTDVLASLNGRSVTHAGPWSGSGGSTHAASPTVGSDSICRDREGGSDDWVCFTVPSLGLDGEPITLEAGKTYVVTLYLEFDSPRSTVDESICLVGGTVKDASPVPGMHECPISSGNLGMYDVIWYYDSVDYPARMEVLVPSAATTEVAFEKQSLANPIDVELLASSGRVPGGVPTCGLPDASPQCLPTFTWNGEDAPDGSYNLTLRTRTVTPPDHPLYGSGINRRTDTGENVSLPFILDSRAPQVEILTPSVLGNPLLTASLEIPVRWRVTDPGADAEFPSGSGVESVSVFATGVNPDGSIPEFPGSGTAWTTQARELSTLARERYHRTESGVDNYVIVVVARDRVGNVDGLPEGWHNETCVVPVGETQPVDVQACMDAATTAAVQAKLQATRSGASVPGVKRVTLDLSTPVITDAVVDGGLIGSVDGSARRIVRAGADVTFTACVQEGGSGLDSVNVFFVREPETDAQSIITHKRALAPVGNGCYAFDGWGAENTNPAVWPNGNWTLGFEAFDRGANKAERLLDTRIFLDGTDPVATARLVLPDGQTALRPGQAFSVEIDVQDASGVQPGSVIADTSAVSSKSQVHLRAPPAGQSTYRALVTVDKADVTAGEHLVEWTLADAAGNVVTGVLPVNVTIRDYEIEPGSVRVIDTTFNGFTVAWNTTAPADSQIQYGLRPLESDLTKRTVPSGTFTTTHEVTVTDLAPSTRYFFRVVSTDDGGLRKTSEIIEIVTDTALYLDAIGIHDGDALSGNHRVTWTGGLYKGESDPRFTVDVREDEKPWQFVTTLSESGAEHGILVNTSRYLDGGNYSFRVTVEHARETVSGIVRNVTIDNTPPEVSLEAGAKATRDTRPVIAGVATDALSGLHVDAVQLTIDGEPVQDALVNVTLDEHGALAFEYKAPQALEIGPHDVSLVVTDVAGSAFVKNWTLHVDVAPAAVHVNPVTYAPGPLAAKDGGDVTLNLTITDPAGIESVTANLTGLRANATELAFVNTRGTDLWTLTFTVDDPERDGAFDVPVRVTDEAGNVVTSRVPVLVDTAAPALLSQTVEDVGLTSARVRAEATEPVRATVTFTAPKSTGEAATELFTRTPTVPLADLLPSRTYAFTLTVSDGAGNTVTDSGEFTTADDTVAPDGVDTVTFFDKRDGRVRVEWPAASDDVGVDYYRVYRGTNGTDLAPHAETTETFFEESGLPLETEYRYAIAAVDHGGNEGPRSPIAAGASTSPPVLEDGGVSPEVGSTHTTTFKFTVTYRSAGGVAPAYVRVVIDGVPHDMLPVEGEDPREGITFAYETRLAPTELAEPHVHHFEASDGRYVVKFPKDTAVKGPLVSGDLLAEDSGGLVNFAKRIPAAGFGGILGGVVLAAAAVLFITRRRSIQ